MSIRKPSLNKWKNIVDAFNGIDSTDVVHFHDSNPRLKTPSWSPHYDGYYVKESLVINGELIDGNGNSTYGVRNYDNMNGKKPHAIVLLRYGADKMSLGLGFDMFYVVVDDKPFHNMDAIWKTFVRECPKRMKMKDNGRISGVFGNLNEDDVRFVGDNIRELYELWERFPNAKNLDEIDELEKYASCVNALNKEILSKRIHNEIKSMRSIIKDDKETLADLEKKLNELYEKAADAMNELESRGYPQKLVEDNGNDIEDDEGDW